jgi:hypothetical protein
MFARSSTLGLLAAVALSMPSDPATEFTFQSVGAVTLSVKGDEARYSLTPEKMNGKPVLAITLGSTGAAGALVLFTAGDELPKKGRYPIIMTREHEVDGGGRWFHACFMAGTATRPLGVFHSESGWVTITEVKAGRISGEFEVRARGFLAADTNDEDQWVTVRGTFTAEGDSTLASVSTASVSNGS